VDTAIAISLLIVIALLISVLVLTSVQFLKALQAVLSNADRAHDRSMKLLADTQDRFMAMDFASFKAMQLAAQAEEGYIEESVTRLPTDATVTQEEPSLRRRWFANAADQADTQIMSVEELEEIERRERARENR
jgi:Na+-transporting NADH:ubiquinone oxidoreductase subunit NqrC